MTLLKTKKDTQVCAVATAVLFFIADYLLTRYNIHGTYRYIVEGAIVTIGFVPVIIWMLSTHELRREYMWWLVALMVVTVLFLVIP